jgi:8-oxo-dGTP diphosphatase/2-hydroxy-dATP diphosphatase
MEKKIATVLVIIREGKVLLGLKKRGFGEGRRNGFGGKPNKGESIEDAAIRETQEECGIIPKNISKYGTLDFEFAFNSDWNQQVHFFAATDFEGQPMETEEMKPGWFSFVEIPYNLMWPDDRFWLPLMLAGKKFSGKFVFGENNEILSYVIKEVGRV